MYAIKDKDTELYVTRSPYRLATIEQAFIFSTKESAELVIGNLVNSLAWSYLEHRFNKDRWHLDVTFKELADALKMFKNLTIVEVNVDETT